MHLSVRQVLDDIDIEIVVLPAVMGQYYEKYIGMFEGPEESESPWKADVQMVCDCGRLGSVDSSWTKPRQLTSWTLKLTRIGVCLCEQGSAFMNTVTKTGKRSRNPDETCLYSCLPNLRSQ